MRSIGAETSPGRISLCSPFVYLLYVDDAGSPKNRHERCLVLGALVVHESQAHALARELDRVAQLLCGAQAEEIELRASDMGSGRGPLWSRFSPERRRAAIRDVLGILASAGEGCGAFASVIDKSRRADADPMRLAFEEICSRFDVFLDRMAMSGDRQRGLVLLDLRSRYSPLREIARQFPRIGSKWGYQRHMADTVAYIDARASRLVQLASHVAYAAFRRHERGDPEYYNLIAHRVLENGGAAHGESARQGP